MRQICTSRKVWLPILLLFTAVFIFACWDRGVAIDFDGTGLYHASPLDSAIEYSMYEWSLFFIITLLFLYKT